MCGADVQLAADKIFDDVNKMFLLARGALSLVGRAQCTRAHIFEPIIVVYVYYVFFFIPRQSTLSHSVSD